MARMMKDSGVEWIGQVPESWQVLRNKNCFSLEKNIVGDDFEQYQLLSLTKKGIVKKDIDNAFGKTPESYSTYQSVKKGQMVMCLFDLDMSAVFSGLSDYDGMISPAYKTYNCNGNMYNAFAKYWFEYCFDGRKYKIYSKSLRYVVNAEDFGNIEIVVPPMSEQEKITRFLNEKIVEVDAIIDKTKGSVEEYKKYKQSVIIETVTKGLERTVPMKNSGIDWIGEMPKDWKVIKIKYVSDISRGLFNHRPRNDERYYGGEYPFIQTGDVAGAMKYIQTYSQTLNELGKSVSKEFPKGTLTMTIAANVGDVAILDFDSYFPDSVVGFVPKDGVDNLYLYYVFKAMKKQFVNASILSTQLNLNIERAKELVIPYTANIDEQHKIVEFLDAKCGEIDALIAKKEAFVEEMEAYKKSLIYEYVTGKKEVK